MFLSKKSAVKIIIFAVFYAALIGVCISFGSSVYNTVCLLVAGVVAVLSLIYLCGKGKFIMTGNKLLRKKLKPAEFLAEYEKYKNADDLIINKPSMDILQLVFLAYDLLDDKENGRATIEKLVNIAPEKRQAEAKLLKVSALFSYGEKEEAEKLFTVIKKQNLNLKCKGLADIILKSDRALAFEDYATAENYCLQTLNSPLIKYDNVNKLVMNFTLGKIYEKTQRKEKSLYHYKYCAENGGETAIKAQAIKKLEELN